MDGHVRRGERIGLIPFFYPEDLSVAGTKLLLDAWKHQQNLAGVKWEEVESGMKERVKTIYFVSPSRMEQLLTEAGFHRIQRFFQNMMLGGWIAFKA